MAQYCRYCNHMVCGDSNYCSIKKKCYSDKHIKSTNKCKSFDLNSIDVLWENEEYKPRTPKQNSVSQQIKFNIGG